MNSFEAFNEYLAVKSHFSEKGYDYFRYHGKTSARPSSFEKRSDKYFFMKLAKQKDVTGILVANMLDNPSKWIKEIVSEEGMAVYRAWLRRRESLSYNFRNELKKLNDDFNSNLKVKNGLPPLIELYIRNEISLETLVIIADLVNCFGYWNSRLKDDPVWSEISMTISKYRPFLKYEKSKFRDFVVARFGLK